MNGSRQRWGWVQEQVEWVGLENLRWYQGCGLAETNITRGKNGEVSWAEEAGKMAAGAGSERERSPQRWKSKMATWLGLGRARVRLVWVGLESPRGGTAREQGGRARNMVIRTDTQDYKMLAGTRLGGGKSRKYRDENGATRIQDGDIWDPEAGKMTGDKMFSGSPGPSTVHPSAV